jgi:quercetin dioxygenase-like cupin family protein
MDAATFETAARADGYAEVARREWEPNRVVPDHTHPFDARVLVLDGEVTLTMEGRSRTCRAGEVFEVAAGVVHSERYGPDGARFLSGRRRVAAQGQAAEQPRAEAPAE